MSAVTRGAGLFAVSAVLGVIGWFVLNLIGSPTPADPITEIDQPAVIGIKHAVQFLGAGAVAWFGLYLVSRLVGRLAKR